MTGSFTVFLHIMKKHTLHADTSIKKKNQTNTKIREIKKEFTIQVNADSLSKAAGCLVGYCNNPLIA